MTGETQQAYEKNLHLSVCLARINYDLSEPIINDNENHSQIKKI